MELLWLDIPSSALKSSWSGGVIVVVVIQSVIVMVIQSAVVMVIQVVLLQPIGTGVMIYSVVVMVIQVVLL